jgi:hypothetical protein
MQRTNSVHSQKTRGITNTASLKEETQQENGSRALLPPAEFPDNNMGTCALLLPLAHHHCDTHTSSSHTPTPLPGQQVLVLGGQILEHGH